MPLNIFTFSDLMKTLNFSITTEVKRPYIDKWVNFYDKEYDFTIGTPIVLFYGEKFGLVETTMPYHFTVYVFAVPPGKEIPFYKKLDKPFSLDVWLAICGSLTVASLVIYVVRKRTNVTVQKLILGSRTTTPFLNLVRVILTGEITTLQMPRRNFARFLLANSLIFALIFQSAYTGSLFSILESNVREPTPESIDDIFNEKYSYKVYLGEGNFDSYDFIPEVVSNKVRTMNISDIKVKLRTDPQFRGVFPTNLDYIFYDNVQFLRRSEPVFRYCPQIIYTYPRTMSLQRNSLLATKFSMLILRLQSAGLLHHWEEKHIASEEEITQFEKTPNPPKPLSFDKMIGLVNIFVIGWIAGLLAFLYELKVLQRIYQKIKSYSYVYVRDDESRDEA